VAGLEAAQDEPSMVSLIETTAPFRARAALTRDAVLSAIEGRAIVPLRLAVVRPWPSTDLPAHVAGREAPSISGRCCPGPG
jgi:hypothetical protein